MSYKVGDIVYQTPQSPGKIREKLTDGYYMVEWLTKKRGITKERWFNGNFVTYVGRLETKYKKYQKKLDKIRNWA